MRPTLQLRIGQQLTMTPQLQQAIKLLQLSTLELQQEIQEVLESNPLLEINEQQTSDDSADNNSDNDTGNNADNLEEAFSATISEKNTGDGSEDSSATIDEISTTEAMEKNDT